MGCEYQKPHDRPYPQQRPRAKESLESRDQQAGQGVANAEQGKKWGKHCLMELVLAFFLPASTDLAEVHHHRFQQHLPHELGDGHRL